MAGAVAKQEKNTFEACVAAWSRAEVIARYRHLREISVQHHQGAMKFLSPDAVLHHAGRLGLAIGRTLVLDDMEDMHYAFDLAIHTAPASRTRAIDRYARAARHAPESDEALVLAAMRNARFAVICVESRHEAAGLIVTDLFRRKELWLVDEGMEISFSEGELFATRLYTLDSFSMTAGVGVPFDLELLQEVLEEVPQLGRKLPEEVADDRRFAEAVYRVALQSGLTEQIAFQDPVRAGG